VTRIPWWAWTLGALALVVAIVALVGGFASTPERELPIVPLGETVTGGELAASVDSVYLTNANPDTGDIDATVDYLVVETTIENISADPSAFIDSVLRVAVDGAIEESTPPSSILDTDRGLRTSYVQPGVPVTLSYVWSVDAAAIPAGTTIYLGLFDQFRVYGDPIFGDGAYTRPTVVAKLSTKLTDVRSELVTE
jgi:hypothetical protein